MQFPRIVQESHRDSLFIPWLLFCTVDDSHVYEYYIFVFIFFSAESRIKIRNEETSEFRINLRVAVLQIVHTRPDSRDQINRGRQYTRTQKCCAVNSSISPATTKQK